VGFKDTFTVQLAPPARALSVQAPAGLASAKSLLPERLIPLIVTEDDPVFLMVMLRVELEPTATLPKLNAVADEVICAKAAEAGNRQTSAASRRKDEM
jgi:hypothetical protein